MPINVPHVAKLANLTLQKSEEEKLEKQLEEILSYVETLSSVDTSGIEETSQVTGLENVVREDVQMNCELSQEEAVSGSKPASPNASQGGSTHNGLFKVKGILPNE